MKLFTVESKEGVGTMRIFACALIVGAIVAPSAGARAEWDDQNGYTQIKTGDYAAAERLLQVQRIRFPVDPDISINLAVIYSRTDRAREARALYQSVLDRPDEMLLLGGEQEISAHRLAANGLRLLPPLPVITR